MAILVTEAFQKYSVFTRQALHNMHLNLSVTLQSNRECHGNTIYPKNGLPVSNERKRCANHIGKGSWET